MEEAHELTSMIANSNIQPPEEIIEQPFTRMTAPTPLTVERPSQSRPAQPSAPKQRSIYPIMEENSESDQARKCTGKHTTCTYVLGYGMPPNNEVLRKKNNEETLGMEQNSEDAVQHNEASYSESQPVANYIVIESDIETESETQRDGLFGDYDAPREEIRRCIIEKLGPAAWDYLEFALKLASEKVAFVTTFLLGGVAVTGRSCCADILALRDIEIFILNISLGSYGGQSQARIFSIKLLGLLCFYLNVYWRILKKAFLLRLLI
ncbi:hypothetical protein OUZ56_011685 [Daphnia magna]|uniref:Uncharacterized protein n=1 Tax=Daphnia magna TaxID=35525 RepID=A0ABQ9Z0V3_9CRUS|nr:hypothetical protein OUZ56_011685 [Daphnia magna]